LLDDLLGYDLIDGRVLRYAGCSLHVSYPSHVS
jgi:hypothetical protein